MDELVVADTGTTGHYLTLNYQFYNKQISVTPLPIRIPNREIITSIHMALIAKPDLTIEAQKGHIFPVLNKALFSIGTFCDRVCQSVFDDKTVLILNKGNGKQ